MAIYWVMLFVPLLSAFSPLKADKFVRTGAVIITFASLVLIIGFRDSVGCDWQAYSNYYYFAQQDTLIQAMGRTEPIYGALNWISARFGWGVYGVNVACGAIFALGLVAFCRRQPLPPLTLAVAIPYMVIVVAMGYTRQAAALGFVMLAFNAFSDRRWVRFLVLIAAAALFHKAALALAPAAVFMRPGRFKGAPLVSVVAAALLIIFLGMESLDKYIYGYIEQQYEGEGALYRLPINALAATFFLMFRKRWKLTYTDDNLYFLMAMASFAVLPLMFVNMVAADRIGLYLLPFQVAVFARVPHTLGRTSLGVPAFLAVAAGSMAMLYVWLQYANHASCWVPYNSMFF